MNNNDVRNILKEEIILAEGTGELLKMFKNLAKQPINKVVSMIRKGWADFKKEITSSGNEELALTIINKKFHTNYKSLSEIDKLQQMKEDIQPLTEDFKHYVMSLKDTVYTSSLVMGMLSVWLEFAKLLNGKAMNYKNLAFFGTLWLILASSKYYGEWKNWKKAQKQGE